MTLSSDAGRPNRLVARQKGEPEYMQSIKISAIGLLVACLSGCFQNPEMLKRTHAYDGPVRKDADIAAIFAQVDNGYTTICRLNGDSLLSFGVISDCPSVVYVLPGEHTLRARYQLSDGYRTQSANGFVSVRASAGNVYRINTSVDLDARKVRFYVEKMPDDFVLTYKDIAPDFFRKQPDLVNSRIDSQDASRVLKTEKPDSSTSAETSLQEDASPTSGSPRKRRRGRGL